MLISGQVRLSKGQLSPAGLGKGPMRSELTAGARLGKKQSTNFFNNPRTSILLGSAPDPKNQTKLNKYP